MPKIMLAVDGGATKTIVSIRSEDGTILYTGYGEGVNYQTVGADQVISVLQKLLIEAKPVLTALPVELAVFALAGIDSDVDRSVVSNIIVQVCNNINFSPNKLIVENDAFATLLGAVEQEPGALLISGTGSIAVARNGKGKMVRVGGWGHLVGDEGSGYWIGREIIRSIARMEDGRGPETMLRQEALQLTQLPSVEALANSLYSTHFAVSTIAQLSMILDAAVKSADVEANRILKEALAELSLLVAAVIRKSELQDIPCKLYLMGGAVTNSALLLMGIKKYVTENFPCCKVRISQQLPIDYIVKYGFGLINK
ncbi:N-acetylglucosamine kinase [Sporosarcina sp. HYO08]|uniref:N-acetylglucosamine kinase n=1 Tax=Sporosarcina sp. HYO08 TaxID=1759557 RepID=UPI0007943948|nr:BadF/BadG/BcrA/BcrD ATPase family protein [Sporosarcina sp. HYO08]KXH84095.1 hypothetical protein AU377_04920 [Sporosarcina sp. HYO08]